MMLQVCAMACQSAISGFKNISQAKARATGVLSKVVAMVVCMACIAVASASSINSLAWVILPGGLVCMSVLSTLFTAWCILSQIALDCGFLLVEHMSLMLKISNSNWSLFQRILLSCHASIIQDKGINKANFAWTCHVCVQLSNYHYGWAWWTL